MDKETNGRRSRISDRKIKKVKFFDTEEPEKKQRRSCEKSGCLDPEPRCCLMASGCCCRDGYTSRWYHISLGEHFCNECFDYFYRSHKDGFLKYDTWCRSWFLSSQIKPTMKRFVAEEAMPYWLRCTVPSCGKWREVQHSSEPSPSFIGNFKCEMAYTKSHKTPCGIAEETCVFDVGKPNWLNQLVEMPLLKKSPAGPYLKQFYPEGIGLCPLDCTVTPLIAPEFITPFEESLNGLSTMWVRPDIMELEEIDFINQSVKSNVYLALRNLIVALWMMSPTEWLTLEKVSMYLICRGLVRILLLKHVEKIIKYLTAKSTINYGLVTPPNGYVLASSPPSETVIVIGAGMAGLSAAKHLHNMGIKVIVLEARQRIGGQICDDSMIGFGAQFINGIINSPLTILSHQAGFKINILEEDIIFINENGVAVNEEVIQRMQHQYSGIMHGALEWAKESNQDKNWFETISKHQEDFHQLSQFTKEEDNVFDLHLKINEIEKRVNTNRLTLYNYEFPAAIGDDGYISEGFSFLLNMLAEGLDIHLNCKVLSVNYEDDIIVTTTKETFKADKVLLTVPINLLRSDTIEFEPPLPDTKLSSINEIGTDVVYEKLFLQFPCKFWDCVLKEPLTKFAIVGPHSLPFQYFVDITYCSRNKEPILLTFITDCTKDLFKDLNDDEIIKMCVDLLKKLFSKLNVTVPDPSRSVLTHWHEDPFIMSSGTYIKVGTAYNIYDELAKDVEKKLYFAGEATFRKCPNTLTGAYLSGLREASNIADSIIVL